VREAMDVKTIRRNLKNLGISAVLYDLTVRAINRVTFFTILKGVKIVDVDPKCLKIDGKFCHGFLSEAQLREFAKNPAYEMTDKFLDQALEKGDQCYGILDGNNLASYGWYSNKPTAIHPEDLLLNFSNEYIYMYKGFTHENYRGQRLHSIGMSWALKIYREKNFKGLVSYVESHNFSSLKSCYRMGYQDFGKIYVLKLFNRYLTYAGKGCGAYNFKLALAKLSSQTTKSEQEEAPALQIRS
jgi:hypothetical protein